MQIVTDIKEIFVEVDGATYPVAERTIEVAERLKRAEDAHVGKSMQYELWLAQLEVVVGKEAVKAIFPRGKSENLDRMENIYCGVMKAFNINGEELSAERMRETLDQVDGLVDQLEKVESLARISEKYPVKKAR